MEATAYQAKGLFAALGGCATALCGRYKRRNKRGHRSARISPQPFAGSPALGDCGTCAAGRGCEAV